MIARASGTLLVLNRVNAESVETVVGTAPDKLGKTEGRLQEFQGCFLYFISKEI